VDPGLTRAQIAVYVAIGVVLLLLGLRTLSGGDGDGDPGTVRLAAEPVGGKGEGAASGDVVVHVAGAVAEPGVFRLPAGSRVADAIERAGGPGRGALTDAINLAARLADGQQVVVPHRSATRTTAGGGPAGDGPISLGTATEADLETIEGIGPVTAAKIIAYRDENGGVASIEQLDEVPGIGPATIESLSDRLQP
jgi:competence protein ComEA